MTFNHMIDLKTGGLAMEAPAKPVTKTVPRIVPVLTPVVRRLIGVGLPLGPNALLTVRGRRTGERSRRKRMRTGVGPIPNSSRSLFSSPRTIET